MSERDIARNRRPLRQSYLPVTVIAGLALVRIVWFSSGTLRGGDLLVPADPVGYMSERMFAWNVIDLGMPSALIARLFNPLMGLVATSYVLSGSPLYGEAFYVVSFTLLSGAAAWSLTRYLWPSKSQWSLLVTSVAYESSTFMINDGLSTSVLFLHTYALIPVISFLLLRGLRESDERFIVGSSILTMIIASTMPNFKDLAFLAIVLAIFLSYGVASRFLPISFWRPLGRFVVYSILLNLSWLLPLGINIVYWTSELSAINVSGVTLLSRPISDVLRGVGKWGFDSGYAGLLYHPYSVVYESPLLVLIGFFISILAFSPFLFSRPAKRTLFVGWFSLLFLYLTKGSEPPLGNVYSSMVLLGPLRVFRESFFFMQFLALGYAFLLGEAVEKIPHSHSATSKSVWSSVRKRLPVVAPALLIMVLLVNTWPLYNGAVAENWYIPGSRGVQFPKAYHELAEWLDDEPRQYRILVLPRMGNYVAFHWGFQGGSDIFHGLFSQPVIVGSSWSEYAYPTASDVDRIYEAADTNDTKTFKALIYWYSARYALIDDSRDVSLYQDRPLSYYEAVLTDAGYQLRTQLDFLRVYEFPDALPLTYAAEAVLAQNTSLTAPGDMSWRVSDFRDGWQTTPFQLQTIENATYASFQANGTRVAFASIIEPSAALNSRYLLVEFSANSFTTITLAVWAEEREYLFAMNPPSNSIGNHYQSHSRYILAFELPSKPTNRVELYVTNEIALDFVGKLEVLLYSISAANDIGLPSDLFQRVISPSQRAAVVPASYAQSCSGNLKCSVSFFEATALSRTMYEVTYSSSSSTFLVLNEAFNQHWKARIGSVSNFPHFESNFYANGWILPSGTNVTVTLVFDLQDAMNVGLLVSMAVLLTLCVLVVILSYRRGMGLFFRRTSGRNTHLSERPLMSNTQSHSTSMEHYRVS